MSINIRHLLSISCQLALQACTIIEKAYSTKTFQKYLKGEDDLVTDTDLKVQAMLIKGLKMHFPTLKIIGEQSQQSTKNIQFQCKKLEDNLLDKTINIETNFDEKQLCLWIDPIDCTRGFVRGQVEDVTTLIGLSYKNQAEVGLIASPYKNIAGKAIYQPTLTIGSKTQKLAYQWNAGKWKQLHRLNLHQQLLIATSNTRQNQIQDYCVDLMNAQKVKAGGSGRKIMMVIEGEADAMAYIDSWSHKWDTCAGQAIVGALGGHFTTPTNQILEYNDKNKDTSNKQGLFCTLHPQLHKKFINLYAQIKK